MTDYLFPAPEVRSIPVAGESAAYPIHRIFCVGRNYADHAREMGHEPDMEAPFYFTKSPSTAVMTGSDHPYPPGTENYHFEMELAVALQAPLFRASRDEAAAAVYAYGSALDMTRRDRQQDGKDKRRPWDLGKDFENAAVFAEMTKASDFGPIGEQRIWLTVNGEVKQDAKLSQLLHNIPGVLSHLSDKELKPRPLYYLAGVDDARFRRPVTAGDRLEIVVSTEKVRRGMWRYACEARVGERTAVSARILCAPGR